MKKNIDNESVECKLTQEAKSH